jgi:hypothetical protein
MQPPANRMGTALRTGKQRFLPLFLGRFLAPIAEVFTRFPSQVFIPATIAHVKPVNRFRKQM